MPRLFPPPGLFQDPKPMFEQLFPQQTIAGGMEGIAGEPGPTIGQILGFLTPGPEQQIMGLVSPLTTTIPGVRIPSDPSKISKFGKALIDKAKKAFGMTGDISEAGFLLPEGEFLDFSGKLVGGPSGIRSRDHREIEQVLPRKILDAFYAVEGGRTKGMRLFQKATNSIRFSNVGGELNIDILRQPTSIQIKTLLQSAKNSNGSVVDVLTPRGEWVSRQFMFPSELRTFLVEEMPELFKRKP